VSNTLSVYLSNHHDWVSTWGYIAMLDPAWIRVHQPTARTIFMAQQAAPNAKLMLRVWDFDDSDGNRKREAYANPQDAAVDHMRMWDDKLARWIWEMEDNGWDSNPSKWYLGLINEPDPTYLPQIVEYTAKAMEIARCPLGVMCSSVGTFGIGDDLNNWSLVKPLERQIRDGGHILMVHEYWQPEGPSAVWTDHHGAERRDAGYVAWRHRSIPLDVPILVGESGANGYIYNRHSSEDDAGWQKFMSADQYAAQVREYIAGCDTRVEGVCLFMTDYHSDQWASFDTTPAHEALLRIKDVRSTRMPVQPDDAHNVYVPIVVMDGPQVVTGDPHYGDDEDEVKPVIENRGGLVDPLALQAILQVESGGEGFENGRLKIRFEAHVFKDRLGNDALFEQHFEIAAHEPWKHPQYMLLPGGVRSPIHMTQASEYAAFRRACMIDELAAFESISMGIGQTMGFNAGRLGYTSPQAMYYDYGRSLNAQIIGAVNFILTDDALRRAVNGGDWRTVALLYNGPGWLDLYVPRLRSAYEDLLL